MVWLLLYYKIYFYDTSVSDSPLDENESPWVPNVVLIENDSESIGLENSIDAHRDDNAVFNEEDRLEDFHDVSQSQTIFKGLNALLRNNC